MIYDKSANSDTSCQGYRIIKKGTGREAAVRLDQKMNMSEILIAGLLFDILFFIARKEGVNDEKYSCRHCSIFLINLLSGFLALK